MRFVIDAMRRNTFDQGQPERIVGRNVGCNAVPTNIMIENQYVVPFDWRRCDLFHGRAPASRPEGFQVHGYPLAH